MTIEAMKQALELIQLHVPFKDGEQAARQLMSAIAEAEKQVPFMWVCYPFGDDECAFSEHQECENCIPLYKATPPQRPAERSSRTTEWVGLTDEEKELIIGMLCKKDSSYDDAEKVAQAIEAKLKEKNTL